MKDTKISFFDHNFSLLLELASLAEKMKADCYSEEKSTKEIKRDFLIGIKKLRDWL